MSTAVARKPQPQLNSQNGTRPITKPINRSINLVPQTKSAVTAFCTEIASVAKTGVLCRASEVTVADLTKHTNLEGQLVKGALVAINDIKNQSEKADFGPVSDLNARLKDINGEISQNLKNLEATLGDREAQQSEKYLTEKRQTTAEAEAYRRAFLPSFDSLHARHAAQRSARAEALRGQLQELDVALSVATAREEDRQKWVAAAKHERVQALRAGRQASVTTNDLLSLFE
ncbi:hypothetical protein J8273_7917 [Carpediemonas membranifera]|uniref:Uncharacterized protein n=1 Tax=Carpediemonas membranifera TaxID=201153 RepID=A0A8J6DZL5_9EUKA|nr:hypothetical protein J8273_7917 [Carpediemonas membranifera]|eukprot:KAG9390566.1 hypothetical protein J8273_7917 [Carpediemonas membranifera]